MVASRSAWWSGDVPRVGSRPSTWFSTPGVSSTCGWAGSILRATTGSTRSWHCLSRSCLWTTSSSSSGSSGSRNEIQRLSLQILQVLMITLTIFAVLVLGNVIKVYIWKPDVLFPQEPPPPPPALEMKSNAFLSKFSKSWWSHLPFLLYLPWEM